MSQFSEEKFRVTRRVAPLKNLRSIDYVSKVYLTGKTPHLPSTTSSTQRGSKRKFLGQTGSRKSVEEDKRKALSSERTISNELAETITGQLSQSKFKDIGKENQSFAHFAQLKKQPNKLSPLSEANREKSGQDSKSEERRNKGIEETDLSSGRQRLRNSMIETVGSYSYRERKENEFKERLQRFNLTLRKEVSKAFESTSMFKDKQIRQDSSNQRKISKEKGRQELIMNIRQKNEKLNEEILDRQNQSPPFLPHRKIEHIVTLPKSLEEIHSDSQNKQQSYDSHSLLALKNLQLQKQQLQRMEQFLGKREEKLIDMQIKEEEEDDEDAKTQSNKKQLKRDDDSLLFKMETKMTSEENVTFLENENELSIIKESKQIISPALETHQSQLQLPLTSQRKSQQEILSNRRKVPNSSNSTTRGGNRDIASILNELDSQDDCVRTAPTLTRTVTCLTTLSSTQSQSNANLSQPPQMAAFRNTTQKRSSTSLKKPINSQFVNFKSLKIFDPVHKGSLSLAPPIISNQSSPLFQLPIQLSSSQTFFSYQNGSQQSASINTSKQKKLNEGNPLGNKNYLQDIKELKKRLNQQSFGMKGFNF